MERIRGVAILTDKLYEGIEKQLNIEPIRAKVRDKKIFFTVFSSILFPLAVFVCAIVHV
jgi:hypothetical protein